jgi:hypothetical protein
MTRFGIKTSYTGMFLQGICLFHDLSLIHPIWYHLKPRLYLYLGTLYIIYKAYNKDLYLRTNGKDV